MGTNKYADITTMEQLRSARSHVDMKVAEFERNISSCCSNIQSYRVVLLQLVRKIRGILIDR